MFHAVIWKLKSHFEMMKLINILMTAIALVSSKKISKFKELQKHLRSIEYDPMDRPNVNGSALNVSVQFIFYSIRHIDKKSFTYSLALAYELFWVDER